MTRPDVSIVTATRNYGRFLGGAIRSVLGQTCSSWELIVVDDGSTDDTPTVIEAFRGEHRIRSIRVEGIGQARAKNLGIGLASAPVIAFLDGDDEWLPDKLERQLPLFRNPDVGIVYSDRVLIDEDGNLLPSRPKRLVRGSILTHLYRDNPICFSSAMVRRSVLERVGIFDPRLALAIDYDLWLRAAPCVEFDHVPAALVRYRTGHANLSRRLDERVSSILLILDRAAGRHPPATPAERQALADGYASTMRSLAYHLRDRDPWKAAWWHLRAACRDGRWGATLRHLIGIAVRRLGRLRPASPPR